MISTRFQAGLFGVVDLGVLCVGVSPSDWFEGGVP